MHALITTGWDLLKQKNASILAMKHWKRVRILISLRFYSNDLMMYGRGITLQNLNLFFLSHSMRIELRLTMWMKKMDKDHFLWNASTTVFNISFVNLILDINATNAMSFFIVSLFQRNMCILCSITHFI